MAVELVDFAPFRLDDPRGGVTFGKNLVGGITTGSGSTTPSVTRPAAAQTGDWLVVFIYSTSGSHTVAATHADWTELHSAEWNSGSDIALTVAIIRLTASDAGPWIFTNGFDQQTFRCEIIRGPGATLHNDFDATERLQNNTSVTSGSVTTLAGGVTFVMVVSKGPETSSDTVPTATGSAFLEHDTHAQAYRLRYSLRHESAAFTGTVLWANFGASADLGIVVISINPAVTL